MEKLLFDCCTMGQEPNGVSDLWTSEEQMLLHRHNASIVVFLHRPDSTALITDPYTVFSNYGLQVGCKPILGRL